LHLLHALYASIKAVIECLEKIDPDAARRARDRYVCFDRYAEDSQAYAYAENVPKRCGSVRL